MINFLEHGLVPSKTNIHVSHMGMYMYKRLSDVIFRIIMVLSPAKLT